MEELIRRLSTLNPTWVYLSVGGIAFLENIFPPFPSDVIVVFAGSLAGIGAIDFWWALLLTTIGSTFGFMVMYKVGDWFGLRILEAGKLRFIPTDSVHKVEGWFRKYGYVIIVANRFLSGQRAVVSFFAGMSELKLPITTVLCFLTRWCRNSSFSLPGKSSGKIGKSSSSTWRPTARLSPALSLLSFSCLWRDTLYKKSNSADSNAQKAA